MSPGSTCNFTFQLAYSFNSLVIHATALSHISLLLSPPTMSGASEPFGTGSNRADSKAATSNCTNSISPLSMSKFTGTSGNGPSRANSQANIFNASNSYRSADPYLSREQRLHIRGGGLREKLFPKITEFGIANGQFYRKRAGQRSGSKAKPGGTRAQERAVRSSHAGVDVPANDQGTGRRNVTPVSRTYGQGEQVSQLLHTSPAAEYVTQKPAQQRPAQRLSEAVGSNVYINQPCQPEPIDGRATNNRTSHAGTLRPPIPPKVP